MLAAKQEEIKKKDIGKLELCRLIGEGYKAMREGRMSTIEEVEMRVAKRRAELSKEPFDYTEWRRPGLEQDLDVAILSQKTERSHYGSR